MAAEVWYLTGWIGSSTAHIPSMEVWSNRDEMAPGTNMRAASDLYYAYGEGLADRSAWAGPGGLVLKFVRGDHPLASLKTVYWTVQ